MNTADLAHKIAGTYGLTSVQAHQMVNKILKAIVAAAVEGEDVALAGFGKFKIKDRPARTGRNPATGEPINIPASKKLVYIEAAKVKQLVNPLV